MRAPRIRNVRDMALRAASIATLAIGACSRDGGVAPAAPKFPNNPAIPIEFRGAAFTVDVSTRSHAIRITPPGRTINTSGNIGAASSGRLRGGLAGSSGGTAQSLLGGDAITLVATNFVAGPLGAKQPGKVLITFDIQVSNKLSGINLITPTFPSPPPSTVGVLMFPFEIAVTTTSGGVSSGSNGSEVVVTTGSAGAVAPSDDWDGNGSAGSGAPWNFFGDTPCTATSTTCFRYEEYGPISSLASSASRKVGFLIDPGVGDFRVQILVAADLSSALPSQTGAVAGAVTSPELGNISGATVNVSGGFSGTTRADGTYTVTGVSPGSHSVTVGNLPNGCSAPSAQSVNVVVGGSATADFSVTCQALSGVVLGVVSSSQGGGLAGVTMTLTPAGASAIPPVTTSASGAYSFASVPVGNGSGAITLSNLPSQCTTPAPTSYSGLTSGGSVTLSLTVTCGTPPATGSVAGSITSNQGGTPLPGVSVVVTPTGGTALGAVTTNASGAYSRNGVPVPPGAGSIAISGVPANCTAPAPTPYTGLAANGTVTVNITVSCTPPPSIGTVTGVVTSSLGGAPLPGVTVIVTPTGGTALGAVTTSQTGAYSRNSVPVPPSTGSILLNGVPSNCTVPSPVPYNGLVGNATVTVNITVICTAPPQVGTVAGTITSSLGGALSGVSVIVTPTGGAALAAVTTNASGVYSRNNVPVPPSTGTVALSALPANCTTPAPTPYSALAVGGTATVNITVTCTAPPQFGTVAGTISSSLGGGLNGVSVVLTPTGGTALPAVSTNASGAYSVSQVPVPPSTGALTLSGVPANCTTPAPTPYSGLAANATVTVNITVTCQAAVTYPFTGTWGAITNTGPTGRQVTLTIAMDMGPAPGRPDVNGPNQDELVSVQYSLTYSGALLVYDSKVGLDPKLTLVIAGSPSAGQTNVIQTSATGATAKGAIQLIRITYNIPAGASGTVTLNVSFVEVLAGLFTAPIDVKSNVAPSLPTLAIP